MLYLVATPIGNLKDITLRAIEVLGEVDFVASEDTRRTGMLLKHLGIKKQQISFHEHNEERAGEKIVGLLEQGNRVALVTSAGTPSISDPGYSLVKKAIAVGVEVTSIPGAAALVSALIVSGLATHSFLFRGFPPRKSGARRRFLGGDEECAYTLVYYESPYRLAAFLQDALDVLGDREAAVVNDLTKFHEKIERGKLSELIAAITESGARGEYVVVIAGKQAAGKGEAVSNVEEDYA